MMERIALIGSGGSGKSVLARELGTILDISVIHLDSLFWKPGWMETPRDEWTKIQEDLVQRETWIIDGNYGGTIDIRLAASDTIIFLDLPRTICLWRVIKPWLQYIGRPRPDMAPGCPEKVDWEFVKWIWSYTNARRPLILERIDQYRDGRTIIQLRKPEGGQAILE